MKIAIFHELHQGGARRAVDEIGKGLINNKHKVDLFYVDEVASRKVNKLYNKTYFYKFKAKKWKGHNWRVRLYKDTIELYKLAFLHKKIANKIDSLNYDFVLVNASKFTQAPFVLRYLKTKKVYYCHDPHYRILYEKIFDQFLKINKLKFLYEKINRNMRKILDRKNILSADLLIANSKYARDRIYKTYKIKCFVCYLGVDHTVFKPGNNTKDTDVLFIGSFEPVDGFELLEASLQYLSKDVKVKSIMVETEWIDNDKELVKIYQKSKLVVCLASNEPFGLVPLEAMACGIPVVAVNEGGYKETIKDGKTGYLVGRNPMQLAEKIDLILKDEVLLKKLGNNGRRLVLDKWTWGKRINLLEKDLRNFINE